MSSASVQALPVGKQGLYVSAEALRVDTDYARALVGEHGFDFFVVRTGFNPSNPDRGLDAVMNVAAELDVRIIFLVGTWWGAGVTPGSNSMVSASSLVQGPPGISHESQWRMMAPGDASDVPIRQTLAELCDRYAPAGICLTHARFKHAADLGGLFEVATGSFAEQMAEIGITKRALADGIRSFVHRLEYMEAAELEHLVEGRNLVEFLDVLSGGDLFHRWFDFRCQRVTRSIQDVFGSLRRSHPEMVFGCNAIGPRFSRVSGQDYQMLGEVCDFIQPLLCYMRWHVLQPIFAWDWLLRKHCASVSPADTLSASARLFGFHPAELRLSEQHPGAPDEGAPEAVLNMITAQINSLPKVQLGKHQPVLNGHALPGAIVREASELVKEACGCVAYQGSTFTAGDPPGPGWL